MPARSKRQRAGEKNTKKARAKKGRIEVGEGSSAGLEESGEVHGLLELATMSGDALDTEDEAVDPSFDLDSSMKDDVDHMIEAFCEEWVLQLDRDDALALGLFLSFQLSKHFNMGATKAAELAGLMIGRSDRTVRVWRTYFFNHEGQIPDCKQGQYQRTGVLWCSEDLNKKAKKYVRNNCNVKGKPNLTVGSFCEWINNDLLPNSTLEPGFPRKVSPETARKWLVSSIKRRVHLSMVTSVMTWLSIARNFYVNSLVLVFLMREMLLPKMPKQPYVTILTWNNLVQI